MEAEYPKRASSVSPRDHAGEMAKIELEQGTPAQEPCPECGGTGENPKAHPGLEQSGCDRCSGTGYVFVTSESDADHIRRLDERHADVTEEDVRRAAGEAG